MDPCEESGDDRVEPAAALAPQFDYVGIEGIELIHALGCDK